MKVEGVKHSPSVPPVENRTNKASHDVGVEKIKTPDEGSRIEKEKNELLEKQKSVENVEIAVILLNKTMESYNTELRFTMHKKSGEYIVKVINTKDNTLIREIPSEKVLEMVAYFKEMLGLVVDKFV